METTTINTDKLQFNCECKGCRGYSPDIAGIVYPKQLESRTQGYFFSKDTMKSFSSRYCDWIRLNNPAAGSGRDNRDGVAVIVSSRYNMDGASRYYELLTICAWGNVGRTWTDTPGAPVEKFNTLRAARKAMAAAAYPAACNCHGCQLDRANGIDRR